MGRSTKDLRNEFSRFDGRQKFFAVLGIIGILLVMSIGQAWILMLLIGAVHSGIASVPALGFGPVLGIFFLFNFVTYRVAGIIKPNK